MDDAWSLAVTLLMPPGARDVDIHGLKASRQEASGKLAQSKRDDQLTVAAAATRFGR